jgi:hypothetical protein
MQTKFDVMKDVRVKELGPSVTTTDGNGSLTKYSYIDFDDGYMLKEVEVGHVLNSKLTGSLNDSSPLELHIIQSNLRKVSGIVAIRGVDGRLFAQDVPDLPLIAAIFPILMLGAGVVLLPVFGIGLIVLWFGWKARKAFKAVDQMRNYVRSLPGVILLGPSEVTG